MRRCGINWRRHSYYRWIVRPPHYRRPPKKWVWPKSYAKAEKESVMESPMESAAMESPAMESHVVASPASVSTKSTASFQD